MVNNIPIYCIKYLSVFILDLMLGFIFKKKSNDY